MARLRLSVLIAGLLLIVLAWWGIFTAKTGLVTRSLTRENIPMVYLAPEQAVQVPGVLVAHGFAGSKQLMLGYGQVLAHAGYAVLLWDFGGHGANAEPLARGTLEQNLQVAYETLLDQPEVDPDRLALLGHSMGSGAVMSAGVQRPDQFAATIAVSPTGAGVTPQLPRNLQLQAGNWEPGFVANAKRLLQQAGGANDNLKQGQGREFVIIPNVEHITILFSPLSHQSARTWLDATFGSSNSSSYVDRRMIWYGLHLLAWLLVLGAVFPGLSSAKGSQSLEISSVRQWGGLFVSPLAAIAGLVVLSRWLEIDSLGGLMVGGAVGLWFGIGGLVWLAILSNVPRAQVRQVGLGLALFLVLWIAFGAMAQVVWLQWLLIPARLKLWPLLAIACFPWFLASGIVQQTANAWQRALWWLGQSVVLLGGLICVLKFLPQLNFLFLLLPLFPVFMLLFAFVAVNLKQPWSYAIGCALFFGWVLAAAFPLASQIGFF